LFDSLNFHLFYRGRFWWKRG